MKLSEIREMHKGLVSDQATPLPSSTAGVCEPVEPQPELTLLTEEQHPLETGRVEEDNPFAGDEEEEAVSPNVEVKEKVKANDLSALEFDGDFFQYEKDKDEKAEENKAAEGKDP